MAETEYKFKITTEGNALQKLINEAEELRDKLRKATAPEDIKKLNKELESTEQKLKDIETATEKFSLDKKFEDIYGDVQPLTGRLGELEDRMYELALAGKANTEEFKALQGEAARMRKTIIDVDKQVDLLADNKGMSIFSAGISEVGDSLLRLDFESAAMQAGNLAKASKGISFGSAIKSLKNLGSTFASLGKALLTNPFFLIVAVVGAIVLAIGKLMDELGILQMIFDAVGDAIGWVIQQLKDMLDWLGLTDYEGEENAKKQIERNERVAKSYEETTSDKVAAMEHEIAMAEALGEDTIEIERRKLIELQAAAEQRIKIAENTARMLIKLHGKDSEEVQAQLEAIEDLKDEAIAAQRQIELFDTKTAENKKKQAKQTAKEEEERRKEAAEKYKQRQKEIAEARLNADRMIQQSNIELIQDEIERFKEMAIFKENQSFKDIDRTHLTNEQIEALERQHVLRLEQIQREVDEKKKAREEKEKKAAEDKAAKELEAAEKIKAQADRLRELRQNDLQNEITEIKNKYDEEIRLAANNTELMEALEEEKQERISKLREDAAKEEMRNIREAQMFAVDSVSAMFGTLSGVFEQNSAASKTFALASIIADTASALMKAVPVALEAAKLQGPAAPFVFAGTLAGIVTSIVSAAANAKQVLSSAPGPSASGGGGGTPSAPSVNVGQPQDTPTINLFENDDTNINAGGQQTKVVTVVNYTDIENMSNETNLLKERVTLGN